jgi:hypothetical protein
VPLEIMHAPVVLLMPLRRISRTILIPLRLQMLRQDPYPAHRSDLLGLLVPDGLPPGSLLARAALRGRRPLSIGGGASSCVRRRLSLTAGSWWHPLVVPESRSGGDRQDTPKADRPAKSVLLPNERNPVADRDARSEGPTGWRLFVSGVRALPQTADRPSHDGASHEPIPIPLVHAARQTPEGLGALLRQTSACRPIRPPPSRRRVGSPAHARDQAEHRLRWTPVRRLERCLQSDRTEGVHHRSG